MMTALALLAPSHVMATPAEAAPVELAVGATVELVGEPGRGIELKIASGKGDYLSGRIEAGAVPLTADLLAGDGSPFRRVARGEAGIIRFQAVAEGALLLRLTPAAAGPLRVSLQALVPPAAQLPPPVAYDSPRLGQLAETLQAGGDTAAFWAEVAAAGTPLVEPSDQPGEAVITFLWRGASRNVRLIGGPSNDHEWLARLGESDVWFRSFRVPNALRLSYQLAPDVPDVPGDARTRRVAVLATAQVDPLNRHPWPADAPDRFAQDSVLTLPDAPDQPGTPPLASAAPKIIRFPFASARLGNSREIAIAMPPELDPADPNVVLALIFDGDTAERDIAVPQMLETLRVEGRLPPVVAVLIPPIDGATRGRELPGNDVFADVMADELLPQIAARTGLRPDPARTVLAGASYGGLAAATIALRRPEVFGNALSMSGSFWWAPEGVDTDGTPYVAAEFAAREALPIRFFLSAGRYETARVGLGMSGGILETSRILRDTLRLKGYSTVIWREYAGGHDWLVWRGALADGLIALFGTEAAR